MFSIKLIESVEREGDEMKESYQETTFSSIDVVALFGITLRQLDYWVKTELVKPTMPNAKKKEVRFFTFLDLVQLRTVKALLDGGMSIQKIRKSIKYIKNHLRFKFPLASVLITDGRTIFKVVSKKEEFIHAVDTLKHQGQGVFLFHLGKLEAEVKEKVKQFREVA